MPSSGQWVRAAALIEGRRALGTLLVALSVAGGALALESRLPNSHLGIVAFDLNGPVPDRLRALGVGVIRGSCSWNSLEPARGTFSWVCADNVIVGAQAFGWRTYMTVVCTPDWANGGAGCDEMPTDVTDWFEFVRQFVARYARYKTILGIWNEPNLTLRENTPGSNYAQLFANASNARNLIAPGFSLAGPEVSHHALPSGYFERTMDLMRSARSFDPQDIVSVHWYADGPPLPTYLDAVGRLAGTQDVWLSETGFATADLAMQSDFFTQVLDEFANGQRPWWTHVIFYRLWDGHDCCTEAILRGDYSTKPAFDRYREWIGNHAMERRSPRPVIGPTRSGRS
jgi:hypothetical protein